MFNKSEIKVVFFFINNTKRVVNCSEKKLVLEDFLERRPCFLVVKYACLDIYVRISQYENGQQETFEREFICSHLINAAILI